MIEGSEGRDAYQFWFIVALSLAFCVVLAGVATAFPSPLLIAIVLALVVGLLTFYNPKLGMMLMVFSMMLSPRLRGASLSSNSGMMGSAVEIRFDDIILVVVFLGWMARTAIIKGTAFLAGTPVHLPAFLYTSVCVISTAISIMQGHMEYLRPTFFVLKYVQYFILFFMTVNIIEDQEDIRRFLLMAWLTAVIVTCFGYAQIPQGVRVSTPFETPVSMVSGDKALADNEANTYGGYFMVVFGLLFAHFIYGGRKVTKWTGLSLLFMMAPFLMTLSRSSYIGLTFMIIFLVAISPRKRASLFFGVAMALLMLLAIPTIRDAVFNRLTQTVTEQVPAAGASKSITGSVKLEDSAMYRVKAAEWILTDRFPKSPLIGWGVSGVGLVDSQFPRVLGETGLLGLSLFLWMIWRIWSMGHVVFLYGKRVEDRALGLGLMAALVGILGHCYGANTFVIVRIMEPFWFLTAMVARIYINERDVLKPPDDTPLLALRAKRWSRAQA